MSSNPFRKKALQAIDTGRPQSPAKSSLRSSSSNSPLPAAATLDGSDANFDSDGPRRPKPVKKPPPPGAAATGLGPDTASASFAVTGGDPFNGASFSAEDESDRETASSAAATPPPPRPPPAAVKGRNPGAPVASPVPISTPTSSLESAPTSAAPTAGVPANPFSKTLQDLEQTRELDAQQRSEGEALKAGNAAARQSLNVDSFRRLLMTGKADDEAAANKTDDLVGSKPGTSDAAEDESSDSTDYTTTEDEVGRTLSSSPNQQKISKEKKAPPPPPSSRHGKSLKDDAATHLTPAAAASSDVNKPLPISPVRRSYDDESPFDREAAGKVPEPEEEPERRAAEGAESATQPAAMPVRQSSTRKPAPAPPPRRGHTRSDTRSEHLNQAPLPPPPRRPFAAPRQTSSSHSGSATHLGQAAAASTPSLPHYYESDSDAAAAASDVPLAGSSPSAGKLTSPRPPAPPPARNPSVRARPPSVSSVDGISRRISSEATPRTSRDGAPPPPPPPKRQRGNSSSSSLDPRRTSGEGASRPQLHHQRPQQLSSADASGKGVDILADLDALQREVDALRGKMR
ncbi:Asp f 13-like protein [Purpureocillium lavendulum]|uniref:Asp f 13-like protein n=1 Tax=Purpureocillium lavendulum TaxID=1247861 RepID=A0AB34FPY3_9HYPO|nr:Asp f 13-like protein [Purpureocillium lavendulum]